MSAFFLTLKRLGLGLLHGAAASGRRMWDKGGTNLAATLAFYSMLSIFPMLILVIVLIGWIARFPASVQQFLDTLKEFAPAYVVDTVRGPLENLVSSGRSAGTVFGIGIVLVIWSASGYVGAFGWSANLVGGVREKRRYLPRLFLRMGVAILVAIVMLLALLAVILTQNASDWIGKQIASLGGAVDVWSTVRWPLFFIAAFFLVLILFSAGPYSKRLSFREMAPGAILGVALWGLASWGFGIYLKYLGQYGMIYGTVATIVVFLMWLWLFNLALLYGVSVNAEIREWRERRRVAAAGMTADDAAPAPEAEGAAAPAAAADTAPAVAAAATEPPSAGDRPTDLQADT